MCVQTSSQVQIVVVSSILSYSNAHSNVALSQIPLIFATQLLWQYLPSELTRALFSVRARVYYSNYRFLCFVCVWWLSLLKNKVSKRERGTATKYTKQQADTTHAQLLVISRIESKWFCFLHNNFFFLIKFIFIIYTAIRVLRIFVQLILSGTQKTWTKKFFFHFAFVCGNNKKKMI